MTEQDHAKQNARGWLDTIVELTTILEDGGEYEGQHYDSDGVRERIEEGPLSVEVRTDWHAVGSEDNKPTEYNILLSTGGPALRIIGDLNQYCAPENAKLEYQDWGTPWTEYRDTTEDEDKAILTYAQQFYFGE